MERQLRLREEELSAFAGVVAHDLRSLDNLIGNAVKYTPAGRSPDITITYTEEAGHHRVEVADRGIGIPDEQRGEVFNAFTRAEGAHSYPGTGLGLAIVQRIIQRHHGTVGADPNPGGGTRFWFTLPTRAPRQPSPTQA